MFNRKIIYLYFTCIVLLFFKISSGQTTTDTLFEVQQLESKVFHNTRAIRVLLPPGYGDSANINRQYPVLYMNDGFALFRYWGAKRTVYHLINTGKIEPIIVIGIDNAAGSNNNINERTNEYLPYPDKSEPNVPDPQGKKYPDFLIAEVMPMINKTYRTKPGKEFTGIGGSSYGAYIALYTYLSRREYFSKLLLESTPLFLSNGKIIEYAKSKKLKGRISIGLGDRETADTAILNKANLHTKEFISMLKKKKVNYKYTLQPNGEHNSQTWASRFPGALEFLFRND